MKLTSLGLLFLFSQAPSSAGRRIASKSDPPEHYGFESLDKERRQLADNCVNEIVDVVIVGAGLAGISAGLQLQKLNDVNSRDESLSFKVLESTNQVGGRAVAAFFYSGDDNPLKKIQDKYFKNNEPPASAKVQPVNFSDIDYYDEDGTVSHAPTAALLPGRAHE